MGNEVDLAEEEMVDHRRMTTDIDEGEIMMACIHTAVTTTEHTTHGTQQR